MLLCHILNIIQFLKGYGFKGYGFMGNSICLSITSDTFTHLGGFQTWNLKIQIHHFGPNHDIVPVVPHHQLIGLWTLLSVSLGNRPLNNAEVAWHDKGYSASCLCAITTVGEEENASHVHNGATVPSHMSQLLLQRNKEAVCDW